MQKALFTFNMPADLHKLLMTLVELAEKNQVLTISYIQTPCVQVYDCFNYELSAGSETRKINNMYGKPLLALNSLGYVILYDKTDLILTQNAFEWANYQRKSCFGKWVTRLPDEIRVGWLIALSIFTACLTIFEIANLLRNFFASQ